ncbi:12518_t:CDS:2 [Funneliformis mosseae]|uniref:12518_t:CDS:1 n=1 Tax=Funneliformis mosseae TaxID=27381 RepID=A0A9N9GJF2_FUNMO|nr:12518_t:CDS:2 [Funneliformis mosseae]
MDITSSSKKEGNPIEIRAYLHFDTLDILRLNNEADGSVKLKIDGVTQWTNISRGLMPVHTVLEVKKQSTYPAQLMRIR